MASEQLKHYPSGFLGSSSVDQTEPVAVQNRARSLLAGNFLPHAVGSHTSNEAVVELWAEHLATTVNKRSWEYQEKVLKIALRAFGTDSFSDWVATQSLSPDYSESHSDWIDDTLGFIYLDKPRQFTMSTWQTLLGPGGLRWAAQPPSAVVVTCLIGVNRGLSTAPLTRGDLLTVLRDWICVPGGTEDLVASLNVLFGKR